MYHAIVRRRATKAFELLGEDGYQSAHALSRDVHHVFPGEHPLGGERHSRAAVIRWLERLGHLFPRHDFHVERVVPHGWPWSTWVAVQWSAELQPQVGEAYVNHGAHWLHLRWGKVVGLYAYLDTQRVAEACAEMARAGVAEAGADPILD
jgi:ketosteroid isomerase-like protein